MTVYELDATSNTFKEISASSKTVKDLVGNTHINPQEMINLVMKNVTNEDHLDEILKFVNLSTLKDRLREVDTIASEYMNKQKLWRRGRFIVSERDENGQVTHLLWLAEDIDQASGPNLNTPVICLTADAISGAREQYISAGFTDYLTKPIYPEQLEDMLIAMLPKEKITLLDRT